MIVETPKLLPENVSMPCYACGNESATHLCKYKMGELSIQVCLCKACMQMDTAQLLKNTIGIQEVSFPQVDRYLPSKKAVAVAG
ncbi:MAG: hypothetical protein M0036_08065 [Desulfobacteraceae bacterium]|nr:hypothetical protein [Desulfobacteraceae bacterium]